MSDEVAETTPEELSSWVFIDRLPSTDEMMKLLETLDPVHGIEVKDYAEYVLPLTQDQNFGTKTEKLYKQVTKLYATVACRVKMLNDAAEKHGWTVDESWKIVANDPYVLRIGIEIVAGDKVLGMRYGVSKAKGGDNAWEKMETAARGRAIAAFGFGVLPGSGIASLEEMQDAVFGEREPKEKSDKRDKAQIEEDVRARIEELRLLRGQDPEELDKSLQDYVRDRLGQSVQIGNAGLDLAKMKPGNLLLLEGQLKQKIAKEERDQSEI